MKRLFKWFFYLLGFILLLVAGVLATAYWNRDRLLTRLNTELNKGINGKVHIEKIDFTFLHHFPSFSITLHKVTLRDNQYETYPKDVFFADKIVVDVALYPLVNKEVKIQSLSIDEAEIFLFKARNGDTNTDVFKKPSNSGDVKKEKVENSVLLTLEKFDFHNVSLAFSDSTKNKSFNFKFLDTRQKFAPADSGFVLSIDGKMHFDSLFFSQRSGSYLKDKNVSVDLNVVVNRLANQLYIQNSTLTYKKNDIGLAGNFEIKKEGKFWLAFTAKKIDAGETMEILNPKLKKTLGKFNFEDPVTVHVNVAGRSIPGRQPNVDISFETTQDKFKYKTVDFSHLIIKGTFTNHLDTTKVRDDLNSQLSITSFKGRMEKIPVSGKVVLTELKDPIINLSFLSKASFKDVNHSLDNDRFVLDKGTFITEVSYNGKLSEYMDRSRTTYQGKLKGRITATNGSLHYKAKKVHLDQIQLACVFNEKMFSIEKLSLNMNGSPIAIKGSVQNFIPFFIQPQRKGYVKLSIHSPSFDLTSLASQRNTTNKSKQKSKQQQKKMSHLLDVVYDKLEFDLDVTLEKLKFRKFHATNFKGKVKLDDNLLEANPIAMQVAGGSMNLNFSLKQVFDPISPMLVQAHLKNVDINQLFIYFNNFNQKTIHADHINGTISADVKFSADVDNNYALVTESMRATLDCKITDGGLKNFEPMENMSNFLFKKRDFSDIQFAELNSKFSVTGTDMDIARMEIQSSVVSLFVEGRYSFKDSTSLSVQLPLSNLKKRHKDFKPKNVGTDAKVGPSVYLHVHRVNNVDEKIQIDYDPFKKWAKN